ncbi:insulin-like growth factor-binding protein complex acid labile subunit [Limulus polyphemus]|uniref:Insulin-like growth factor-binding protein complex acid labile subunit n=1 Tax=Limulus polyphemus TaxID=6850 RepID=A0ABM1B0W4_LIMPO|nr:insulin-like growth factor-binding protein complex acid labile subunit [Limulus polyphemus]
MLAKYSVACPTACFCDESFHYVRCIGNGQLELPPDIPKTAIRLELRNYIVPSLSSSHLEGLVRLQELKLQQAQLQIISNDSLLNLQTLEHLDLSQNLLTVLSRGAFDGLMALRYLDISSNVLVFIDEAFRELSCVEQLNLRNNHIPRLTSKSLSGLWKIQYLNLDSNNISAIKIGTFQYLTNLAHLILSNNPLTTLSRLDFFGTSLQYIDISNIGIQRVPQSLARFVRDLRLTKNNITYIRAGDLDSYHHLGLLVLDDNKIREIEDDALGRLEYLNRLWLNGNKLSSIPVNLPTCLRALYLEENKLEKISSFSFQGLINLEQLFLQRNQIEQLEECAFCDLFNLKSLDLQANNIQKLATGVFEKLTQLQTLDLSQNEIKIMEPRCFFGLGHLKTLQISRTSSFIYFDEQVFDTLTNLHTLELYDSSNFSHQLIYATRALHGLRNLRELNIMHNNLVSLRSDFPSFFPKLKIIKMNGNNWHCNQSILWLQRWITTSNIQFYRSYDVRCASPLQLQFKPIMLLTKKDLTITHKRISTKNTTENVNHKKLNIKYEPLKNHFQPNTTKSFGSLVPVYGKFVSVKLNRSRLDTWIRSFESKTFENKEMYIKASEQTSYNESVTPAINNLPSNLPPTPIMFNMTTLINHSNTNINSTRIQTEALSKTIAIIDSTGITSFNNNTAKPSVRSSALLSFTSTVASAIFDPIKKWTVENPHSFKETRDLPSLEENQQQYPITSAHKGSKDQANDPKTALIILFSLAGSFSLVTLGLLVSFIICRRQKFLCNVTKCEVRRNSSISYNSHKDEVSILTVSDGTVRLQTDSKYEMGNKLYYVVESDDMCQNPTKAALPDPQLQELLPQTLRQNGHFLS